jgi:hypothetical protein
MQPTTATHHGVIAVLYVGNDLSAAAVERLHRQGIGVIRASTVSRGLRLLQQFQVAAALYDVPDLQAIPAFLRTRTPVVLLAAADADWGKPGVRVIKRGTDAAALAAVIRELAGFETASSQAA